MSDNLHKLLKEALLNNSYDKISTDLSLKMTHENSYSYLYALQRSIIDYNEFHYQSSNELFENKKIIGKFYLDSSDMASVDIDYEMVKEPLREYYRRSKYYHTKISSENKNDYVSFIHEKYHELDRKHYVRTSLYTRLLTEKNIDEYVGHVIDIGLTPQDIFENPEIFTKVPVVLIDNKVIWDWILFCNEGSFTLKIPSKTRYFVINPDRDDNGNLVYNNHTIDIFTIDNFIPLNTIRASRSSIGYSAIFKTFKIPKSKLNIDYTKIHDGIMFCSFHYPNENGINYELGSSLIELKEEGDSFTGQLTDRQHLDIIGYDLSYPPTQEKFFYVNIFFIHRLKCHYYPYKYTEGYMSNPYTTVKYTADTMELEANLAVIEKEDNTEVVYEYDEPYQMPVPVENLMVFHQKIHDDGFIDDYTMCKNTEAVELYYPNIYRVVDKNRNNHDRYKIYYFYKEGDSLLYTNLFDFYVNYLRNILYKEYDKKLEIIYNDLFFGSNTLELINKGYTIAEINDIKTTFDKIIHYKDFVYHYGDIDFIKRFLPLEGNEDKKPFEYKVETFREWVKHDKDALEKYVIEQKKVGKMYHMFVNTIKLEDRLRNDTSLELSGNTVFDEPMYLFTFADLEDIPVMLNLRIFVDGIFVNDFYQERLNFMDYIYIPVRYFSDNSYIEAEILPDYTFEKDFSFDSIDDLELIELPVGKENHTPTISDLYLIRNDNTGFVYQNRLFEIKNEYDQGTYEIAAQSTIEKDYDTYDDLNTSFLNDDLIDSKYYYVKESGDYYYYIDKQLFPMGSYYEVNNTDYAKINQLHIKPKFESVVNKNIRLVIHKSGYGFNVKIPEDGYPIIDCTDLNYKFKKKNVRIFVNGRLYPEQNYMLNNINNRPTIYILERFKSGDIIYIDITPYGYNKVYETKMINPTNNVIDLKEYINKPFNPRYYDVYMNGRRLSLNNIIQVDPWSITLVNLKSNYNFVIYEKERNTNEFYGIDYTEKLYYYNIEDLFKESYLDDEDKKEIIDSIINDRKDPELVIEANTNDEIPDVIVNTAPLLEAKILYYNDILPRRFMNPDVAQFDDEYLKENYPYHYKRYVTSPYEETKDRSKISYISALRLNPDEWFEGGEDGKKQGTTVYSVGHMNTVSQTLLNDGVTMNNTEDLIEGLKRAVSK